MLFLTITLSVLAVLHVHCEEEKLLSRVWYGKRANIKDYPYFATLLHHGLFACGANVVSERWLVTAGHCFTPDFQEERVEVVVGADQIEEGQHYDVDLEIRHPDYTEVFIPNADEYMAMNDIALLRLKKPLTFSDKVKPIHLPKHDYEVNVLHTAAGMGADETGGTTKYLMEVNVRTYIISEYFSIFKKKDIKKYKRMMSRVLITTKRDGDEPSVCHGDSGSGLIHDNHLVGLVSYGDRKGDCAIAKHAMYTNVFPFVDWIKSHTGIQ